MPNRNISEVSLGLPGSLPMLNIMSPELAIRLGIALNCDIRKYNMFARKHYFYADLPKGYQITQFDTPICYDGLLDVKTENNELRRIEIERIHMEEDAGKSIHDQDPFDTLIDLNRAGVPLIEIVTRPDFRSSKEAANFLTEIRKLVRYLDVCDGNMEEGSMRCDANISVRLKGDTKLGIRTEVKNMNSIRNVQRAIEYEFERQCEVLEKGEVIYQDTMTFDASTGRTTAMRSKEKAHDYRYFPEPDLPPLILTDEYINRIKAELPELPEKLFQKYTTKLGIPEYDACWITEDKDTILWFEEASKHTTNYKALSNWLMGAIKSYLNEKGIRIKELPISSKQICEIIELIDSNKISNSIATNKLFHSLMLDRSKTALQIAEWNNLLQENDSDSLNTLVDEVLNKYPDKVAEYKNGKKGVLGLFMGEVMKTSKGKADPKVTSKIIEEKLK